MTFKSQLQSDLSIFFSTDEFAESATYIKASNPTVPINTSVIKEGGINLDVGQRGAKDAAIFHLKRQDVGIPAYKDTIDTGEIWTVERIENSDAYVVTVAARRDVRSKY